MKFPKLHHVTVRQYEAAEHGLDLSIMALIVLLGGAMLLGLATASGHLF